MKFLLYISFLILIACNAQNQNNELTKITDIKLPHGYERQNVDLSSFAFYLQHLKINNQRNIVRLYNGNPKPNQNAHFAIIDMDVGTKDLQQCADAIIRLRAEYLWKTNNKEKIHFNFTSGDTAKYTDYKNGIRPLISGNNVLWKQKTNSDSSYNGFKKYLELIFTYAGTYSLNKELIKVNDPQQIQIGDVFIQTGNPIGHAIIVVDMAKNPTTGEKIFLLAQSYMPAQDIHILKNPTNEELNPWYSLEPEEQLKTPEWTFNYHHLKRFK